MPKTLTIHDVEWTLEALPEDIPVRGNALALGDDDEDRAAEDAIIEALDNGDQWAWCCVKLTGRYKGLKAFDTLGACSYADEAEFCQPGGYYDDMRQTVLDDLQDQLDQLLAECS